VQKRYHVISGQCNVCDIREKVFTNFHNTVTGSLMYWYMHVLTCFFLCFSFFPFKLLYIALHCIILCCTAWVVNKLHHYPENVKDAAWSLWPGRRTTSVPSDILIHPTIWQQYTNVTDRQTYIGRTVTCNGRPKMLQCRLMCQTVVGDGSSRSSCLAEGTRKISWSDADMNKMVWTWIRYTFLKR